MTEPQEFSSDFDRWVCSLLDMLRAKGYTNVSVNRYSQIYVFYYSKFHGRCIDIPFHQLQTDFKNNQTPQQILDLIK